MAKKANVNMDENGDFIFRFRLGYRDGKLPFSKKQALVHLMRANIDSMLDVISLTYQGQEQKVDGFVFLDKPGQIFPLNDKYIGR